MIKETTVKKVLTAFIVLLPLLSIMRLPIRNVGVGMLGLILLLPLLVYFTKKKRNSKLLFLLLSFALYCAVSSSDEVIGYICWGLVFIWIYLGRDVLEYIYAMKIIRIVSLMASVLTILQTVVHYFFNSHLVCTVPILIQDNLREQYSSLIYTATLNGMYRPSAFFLEPSHMAKYAIIGLIGCLFVLNDKKKFRDAIIISVGTICTTSSMGVAMVAGVWGIFLFWRRDKGFAKKMTKKQSLVLLMGVVLLIVTFQMPIVKTAMQRVVGNVNGYNAIRGRLFFWDSYFTDLSVHEWIWGRGANTTGRFFTGIMDFLYSSGVVSVVLFYALIIYGYVHGRVENRIIAGLYAVLMIFSGLNDTINLIFYFILIYGTQRNEANYVT